MLELICIPNLDPDQSRVGGGVCSPNYEMFSVTVECAVLMAASVSVSDEFREMITENLT